MSSVNKKSKYTFGGYKEVAQYGISDLANVDYYNKLAQGSQIQPLQPRGYTPPTPQNIVPIKDMPVIQPLTEPVEQQDNNMGFVDKVTGAVETGMQAYQTFIEGKRKLANQINNGIAIAAGVANLFDEAQLRRDENQKRIESLQSAPSQNSNRGLNNIPAYTKYGGNSDGQSTSVQRPQRKIAQFRSRDEILNLNRESNWGNELYLNEKYKGTKLIYVDPKEKGVELQPNGTVRASYNIRTDEIKLQKDQIEDDLPAELAHIKQKNRDGVLPSSIKASIDYILHGRSGQYRTPGTVEYEAHKQLERPIAEDRDAYLKSIYFGELNRNNKLLSDVLGKKKPKDTDRMYLKDDYQYGGNSQYNVEAEQGEVYDNNGDILKINDDAPTHENGGVNIVADRVLENTSSMRKDPMSKSLKLSKEQVSLMSGFEAKKSMSHSDAYEFEAKKNSELQEKFLKAISKVVADPVADKYAIESAKLNADLGLAQLPSENEIFDKYFNHQEQVKEDMGYYDGKLEAKYGKAQDGYYNPYTKGKQKTPTGLSPNFPTGQDAGQYIQNWNQVLGTNYGINDVYELQMGSYDYALKNNPQAVRDMWKTYGLNNKAQQNGITFDTNNLTDEQLATLRNEYADGLLGTRLLNGFLPEATVIGQRSPQQIPTKELPVNLKLPSVATPPIAAQTPQSTEPVVQQPTNQTTTPEEFNQPLEWYDTIGPTATILSALRRDPELYNPVNIAQVRLQQQDVRPALSQNQAEYNAATQNLGNSSIAAAQRAQLFTNKLRADNQIIGQYENANRQIQNQETQYNANARDRQEAANAQSRQNFYDRVLQGRAKQTEQLLTGIDALAKTFAENRAFNRNANLIMKFAPNFDAKGNYNGVPVQFASNSANQPGFATNNGQPVVNEKGQYLLRTTTSKDGKVTEQWVDKAYYDAQVKNASPQRLQTQMILDSMRGGKSRK